uniref:Thioredoxin F-typeic-like n=1 Tax=Rhizophora mucronata TaxID=61149 RepID=A0A2P2KKF1_RHIMU
MGRGGYSLSLSLFLSSQVAKMALIQFSLSQASLRSSPSYFPRSPMHPSASSSIGFYSSSSSSPSSRVSSHLRSLFPAWTKSANLNVKKNDASKFTVKSSLDTVGPTVSVGQVTEVTKDTFWPIVQAAGDKTVVLDMYTQWCGPCKVMDPKIKDLSKKYLDVVFLKLDCNQENKPLAKELGIRVVPTFKILKNSKIVKEVTGAKLDDLVVAIESARSS